MFISVTVCDVCHRVGQPTSPWLLGFQGMTRRVDLCDEHGESLRGLFDIGKLVNDSARIGGPSRVTDAVSAAVPPESRRLRRETERDELHAVMRAQRRTGRHASAPLPKPASKPAPKPLGVAPTPAATAKPAPVAPQPTVTPEPVTPAPSPVFPSDEFDTPLWRSIIQRH